MAESDAVADLRKALQGYLEDTFSGYQVAGSGYSVVRDSVSVFVVPHEHDGQTLVRIWSVVDSGPVDGRLTRHLACENATLQFGKFSLEEETASVHLAHTLLGDFLNRKELEVAVDAIAVTARAYEAG
jgi:hypothetical protein